MATRSADKRRSTRIKEEDKEEANTSKTEARSKLNKALEQADISLEQEKVQPEELSESEIEDDEDLPTKKTKLKPEKEDSPVIKETKLAKAKPFSMPSYIMKLFDRSVNLARFDEETPLYPLCRSWMQNAPRQIVPKSDPDAEPKPLASVEEGDISEMPRVRVRKGGKPLVAHKNTEINKEELDKAIDSQTWTKDKIFDFHRSRWAEDREKAITCSRNFEEKHFAANFELLESLFKGNEE